MINFVEKTVIGIIALFGLMYMIDVSISIPFRNNEVLILLLVIALSYILGIILNIVSYWLIKPFFTKTCYEVLKQNDGIRNKFYKSKGG